jgi:hypothetical protein
MSKDMKLIMENWRGNVLKEQQTIQTAKDFVEILKVISLIKKGEKLGAGAAKMVGGLMGLASSEELMKFLSLNPQEILAQMGEYLGVVSDLWEIAISGNDVKDTLKNLTRLPDEKAKKAGFLGILDINDNYLKIVDNRLENSIINDLLVKFVQMGDTNISDIDLNAEFAESVQKILGGTETLTGAPEKKMGDQNKIGHGVVAKDRLKQRSKFFADKERD